MRILIDGEAIADRHHLSDIVKPKFADLGDASPFGRMSMQWHPSVMVSTRKGLFEVSEGQPWLGW